MIWGAIREVAPCFDDAPRCGANRLKASPVNGPMTKTELRGV